MPKKGDEAGRGLGVERFHHDALTLKKLIAQDKISNSGLKTTDKCSLESSKLSHLNEAKMNPKMVDELHQQAPKP